MQEGGSGIDESAYFGDTSTRPDASDGDITVPNAYPPTPSTTEAPTEISIEELLAKLKDPHASPKGRPLERIEDHDLIGGWTLIRLKHAGRPKRAQKLFPFDLEECLVEIDEKDYIFLGNSRSSSGRVVRAAKPFIVDVKPEKKRRRTTTPKVRTPKVKTESGSELKRIPVVTVLSEMLSSDDEVEKDDEDERDWKPHLRFDINGKKRKKAKKVPKTKVKKERRSKKTRIAEYSGEDNDDDSGDEHTRSKFIHITMKETRILKPRKKVIDAKNDKLISMDPFASPKKQRAGELQLDSSTQLSPSKRGILPFGTTSPARTPNGRAGSPRKLKQQLQELQDKSARKKLNQKLYRILDDGLEDLEDEDLADDVRVAEKIIRESKEDAEVSPSKQTPKKSVPYDLPIHNPDFVATPLPTGKEDEDFFDNRHGDKALFLDGPDGYFDQHRLKPKTSHNSMVHAPSLDYDEFNSLVLISGFLHYHQREALIENYKQLYTQWRFELDQGFNLLFYGIGSKRSFLLSFVQDYLMDYIDTKALVVNGYNPVVSFSEVLKDIVAQFKLPKPPKRNGELVEFVVSHFEKMRDKSPKLIILFHNIDAEPFREEKIQDYLSKLASIRQFIVVASIDHLNAPLLWDSIRLANYNFVWHNLTTYRDYLTETSFRDPLVLGQTQKSAGSKGAKYVLSSLTSNSKALYRVLASNQLQNMEDDIPTADRSESLRGSIKHGLEFTRLFHLCAEEFISSNEINFRTMLQEFVEHKMAVLTKDPSGTEQVFIPFTLDEIQKLLEEELI